MINFRSFAIVEEGYNLCIKHLKKQLEIYENYKDRKYEVVFRLVIDNENEKCAECKELAHTAYLSKIMELRKQ